MMQEFIDHLVQKAGLAEDQAAKAAAAARDFIKSKVPPQMAATIDGFFSGTQAIPASVPAAGDPGWTEKARDMAGDAGDRIADMAGKAKDKAEDFAEDAGKKIGEWADKAGDMAEDAIDKIKGMFGGHKEGQQPS